MKKIAFFILGCLAGIAVSSPVAASVQAAATPPPSLAFVTWIQWESQESAAAMLVHSIRRWAGEYAACPVYVVLADPERSGSRIRDERVHFVSLALDAPIRRFPFAAKAFAAARVEALVAGRAGTLVWLDPETLILAPPREYDLDERVGAAVSPVMLLNTGQAPDEPVDAYWGPIYKRCGLDPRKIFAVETFVDCRKVRAWLNCGMFSVRPGLGLLGEWARLLGEFLNDPEYQRTAITDAIHRTFLHQAVISTIIAARLGPEGIRMLPRGYNYPLYCHDLPFTTLAGATFTVPPHKKAARLEELTSVFLESLFTKHPDWITLIPPAGESLRSWLSGEYENTLRATDRPKGEK